MPKLTTAVMTLMGIVALSGCGSAASTTATSTATPTAAVAARPSSPAVITILSPKNGAVIHGSTVTIVIGLTGAKITPNVTTHIVPTLGHVHLYLNTSLTYMNYSLTATLPVRAGTNSLSAEFVAEDHLPFSPRVLTKTIFFTDVPAK